MGVRIGAASASSRPYDLSALGMADDTRRSLEVRDAAAAQALFAPLAEEAVEVLGFVYLGVDRQILGLRHARSGYADRVAVPIRAVAADALAFDAVAVVMAHNHPSGDPTPSDADREATRLLARALDTLEVRLLDHLVVAARGVVSFRTLGLL